MHQTYRFRAIFRFCFAFDSNPSTQKKDTEETFPSSFTFRDREVHVCSHAKLPKENKVSKNRSRESLTDCRRANSIVKHKINT